MDLFRAASNLLTFGLAGFFLLLGALFLLAWGLPWGLIGLAIMALAAGVLMAIPWSVRKLSNKVSRRRRGLRDPEHSIHLRKITFAAQASGLIALSYVTRLWWIGLLGTIVLAAGHRYAIYRIRNRSLPWVRALVFAMFHLVFLWMIAGIFIGQPYPQAQLAMLGMAVVSWELHTRMNLYSGLGLGLINVYVAATLSRDLLFLPMLLAYTGFLLAFLWVSDTEDRLENQPRVLRPVASTKARRDRFSGYRLPLYFALAMLLFTPVVFLATPHFAGRPLIMPISLRAPLRGGAQGQIVNPAVPLVQIEGWSDGSSEYYYGFDTRLDLSYRGGLNDRLMMYVRSPAWSYWRSHAYDYYDGRTWTQSAPEEVTVLRKRSRADLTFRLPGAQQDPADTFVQTFYVVNPLPNLIFAGGDPQEVYVAADQIVIDSTEGIRVGEPLQAGMVYSVVSTRQDFDPQELRAAGRSYPAHILDRYLQLPDTVSERTRRLAEELTRGAATPYDQVVLIRDWLLDAIPYDYFPPPQAPGSDAVDQFLFVDQQGVCEQYVSAMIVMLRHLGVPARLVSGFGSGTYNQLTAYYEVRALDAHSWVEVFFPGFGWVPFDPTPGWEAAPQSGPVKRWVFSGWAGDLDLPRLDLSGAAQGGAALVAAMAAPIVVASIAAVILALLMAIRWLMRWWRDRYPRPPHALRDHPNRRRILAVYRRAQRLHRARREPSQTVSAHAQANRQFEEIAEWVKIAAYRPEPPDDEMVERARRY